MFLEKLAFSSRCEGPTLCHVARSRALFLFEYVAKCQDLAEVPLHLVSANSMSGHLLPPVGLVSKHCKSDVCKRITAHSAVRATIVHVTPWQRQSDPTVRSCTRCEVTDQHVAKQDQQHTPWLALTFHVGSEASHKFVARHSNVIGPSSKPPPPSLCVAVSSWHKRISRVHFLST